MMACWFGHTWSTWKVVERGQVEQRFTVASEPTKIGMYEIQRRQCDMCGKSQMREVSS